MRTTSRVDAPDILCAVCVWMGPEVRVPRRLPSCGTGLRRGTEPGVVVGDPTPSPLVKARCSLRMRSISRVAAADILSTLHNSKKQAASMATSKTMSSAGVSSHIVRVEHNSRQRLSPRSALLACRLSVPCDSFCLMMMTLARPEFFRTCPFFIRGGLRCNSDGYGKLSKCISSHSNRVTFLRRSSKGKG